MTIKKQINNEIKQTIRFLLSSTSLQDIDEVQFNPNFKTTLLYPTNDLLLTREQFEAILKSNLGKKLYIAQIGYEDDFLSDNNIFYEIKGPFSYEEYSSLQFDSMTILFSETKQWILIVDESIEGGIGLFAGVQNITNRFEMSYKNFKRDFVRFVTFQLRDYEERKHAASITHLENIVNKITS